MKEKTFLFLFLLLFTACSTRVADFTIISTRNIDMDGNYELVESKVKGKDVTPIIAYIPLGSPSIEDAIDDALDSVDGDIMTDVTVRSNVLWFIYFGTYTYVVVGDVWKKV
tara:strand:+ start:272 stop:604 length:333 start_codon:yes stop_codon:yes gene_type:complete